MPNDLLLSDKWGNTEEKSDNVNLEVEESDVLVSLRLDLEDEREKEKKDLQTILTNSDATIDKKMMHMRKLVI